MWEKTVEPIEESRLAIDCRSGYIKRLESFFYFRDTERFLQLPVIINGICYKKIGEILEKTLESLRSRTDSVMVLGHGDDHLANILTDDLSSKPNYYIIDPKLAGFYPPTISYLNTAMYLLLYKYQYIVKENVAREEIRIEYGIPNESVSSKYGMIDVLKIMEYGLLELGGGLGMFLESRCVVDGEAATVDQWLQRLRSDLVDLMQPRCINEALSAISLSEPSIIFIAASMSFAFKSGIFFSAISFI
jgi:hypothetical protein